MTIAWPFDPSVDAGLVAATIGYVWLARRANATIPNAIFFGLGLLVVWVALESPLDTLAGRYLQSAHMAQHMLLMCVALPFLLLGLSSSMAAVLLRLPLLRRLTEPVPALVVHAAALIGWHMPLLFSLALPAIRTALTIAQPHAADVQPVPYILGSSMAICVADMDGGAGPGWR